MAAVVAGKRERRKFTIFSMTPGPKVRACEPGSNAQCLSIVLISTGAGGEKEALTVTEANR